MLSSDIISVLDENIKNFMSFLRHNWPETTIRPKLHMIEDHYYHVGMLVVGFLMNSVGGSIHKGINSMKQTISNVRNNKDGLKYIMDCHLVSTNPHARSRQVHKKEWNLQRKSNKQCQ